MNEKRREEKKSRFPVILVVTIAVFVSFLLSFFLGQSGILRLNKLERGYDRILIENHEYVLENKRLAAEIRKLRHDRATIEKIAREELHFVSPHDVVLLVPSHHVE